MLVRNPEEGPQAGELKSRLSGEASRLPPEGRGTGIERVQIEQATGPSGNTLDASAAGAATEPEGEDPRRALSRLLEAREAIDRQIASLRRVLRLNESPWRRVREGDLAGLEVHIAQLLRAAGLREFGQIRARVAREGWSGLARVKAVGPKRLDEIKAWMAARLASEGAAAPPGHKLPTRDPA